MIAVIGDGSLSGGEALEGLSNAAVLDSNIIIVVNDNEMSIAENHGGLYTNLRLLRETGGKAECNMFKALGFDYRYVGDGNSVEALIGVLGEVKDTPRPTVVHVHTLKGKGYKFAEENKERWHWNLPFDIKTGEVTVETGGESYNDITYDYLKNKIAEDKTVVAVNAGTPGAFGINAEKGRRWAKTSSTSALPKNMRWQCPRPWPKAAANRSIWSGVRSYRELTTSFRRIWQSTTIRR